MWTLILYVYFQGLVDGRAASIDHMNFVKHSSCVEAGEAFVKMANGPYQARFICVSGN